MMRGRVPIGLYVVLLALLALAVPLGVALQARADGVIIVEPPLCDPACPEPVLVGDQLVVKSHRVDVTVADQVATTKIDQVFHNPNDWAAEGTYIFPIPDGAAIGEFTMWVDGEPIAAKLLDATEARRVYDEIVRNMRDPALLEYVGQGTIQASVFPIPPGEDRRIEIEYGEVLTAEQGLVRYLYPLNTERFSAQPLEQVSVRVAVESTEPVRAIYSPSHDVAIDRPDDFHFVAGYEASHVKPDTDFELLYSISADPVGANLVSYFDRAAGEGYFMLLAAPGIDAGSEIVAKDVLIVLDTSGSMEGEKIVQAKQALTYVLDHLNPEDRFNVVEFSTGAREFARGLVPASRAAEAVQWVQGLPATGGTDINLALLNTVAMVEAGRPTTVLFLTDGLPSEGEVEVGRILANVQDAAPENVRLFAFGVGDDVDPILLDSLAEAHHGRSAYVRPGQALDEAVSSFYAGISSPVLADVELDFGTVHVEDVYPAPLPDLFAGTQLIVLGRYREGGPATITLTGDVNGRAQTFVYQGQSLATSGGDDFLPRLWATRKIGYLLNQIRLHGENPEHVQAIVDLSVRFGVVTPYTSYLITEDEILTEEGRREVAQESLVRADAGGGNGGSANASGSSVEPILASKTDFDAAGNAGMTSSAPQAQAIEEAQTVDAIANADLAAAPPTAADDAQGKVRHVGARTFVLKDGVWIETTFDPTKMTPHKVTFASDEYFELLAAHPDLAEAFALGQHVIAISDGQAYEVTP